MSKFAFVIHPLDTEYIERFEPKAKGKSPALIEKVLEWMPAFKLSKITGIKSKTGKTTTGWFIACPFLPKHILNLERKKVIDKIIQAGQIAQDLGAKVLGLGAYTSVVGDAGNTVAKHLDIGVTTGTSYTVASSLQGLEKAVKILGIDLHNNPISIIGATGAIGRACCLILAKKYKNLVLVARNQRRLQELADEIKSIYGFEVKLGDNPKKAAKMTRIIITSTSTPFAILDEKDFLPGSLVLDVSRPQNISEEVAKKRKDVLVVDGGVIKVPGKVKFNFDFGFPPGLAYACISETIMMALEDYDKDYSLGRYVDLEKVYQTEEWAKKHGFNPAGFRSFDKPVSQERIENVKRAIEKSIKNIG